MFLFCLLYSSLHDNNIQIDNKKKLILNILSTDKNYNSNHNIENN